MKKHLDRNTIDKYIDMINMYMLEGRAEIAQKLHSLRIYKLTKDKWVWGSETNGWVPATEICWTRQHNTPRRSCFTPCNESGGPIDVLALADRRLTIGSCTSTGSPIYRWDSWRDRGVAHIDLGMEWVGHMFSFYEVQADRGGV